MKKLLVCLLCLGTLLALCACARGQPGGRMEIRSERRVDGDRKACADALKKLESGCQGKEAAGSCWNGAGEDVVYRYEGFRLKTNRTKENDPNETLLGVEFTSDAVKTPEGMTVGSTADAVKAAYGTPTTESSTSLTYDKGNTRLRFSLRDGKVSGISYVLL